MECDGSPLDRVVNSGGVPATNEKGEYIYLYWGVVDMLQEYDLAHKYQYCWKAVKHGCAKLPQVSVQPPELYKGKQILYEILRWNDQIKIIFSPLPGLYIGKSI